MGAGVSTSRGEPDQQAGGQRLDTAGLTRGLDRELGVGSVVVQLDEVEIAAGGDRNGAQHLGMNFGGECLAKTDDFFSFGHSKGCTLADRVSQTR